MENIIAFIKKYSFEITVISILTAISAALYCIYPVSGVAFAMLCLFVQACAYKNRQRTDQEHLQRLTCIYNCYQETAELAFSIFKTFEYLGFMPIDRFSVCYPDDYFHINNQGVIVFRFKCVLKAPIETELHTLRGMINGAIENNPFYRGLYVLQITQLNDTATIVVTYRDETTEQYIKDYEHKNLKRLQQKAVSTADQDF